MSNIIEFLKKAAKMSSRGKQLQLDIAVGFYSEAAEAYKP